MAKPVCVVVGVGPGNGQAFAQKFAAEGYKVALIARSKEKVDMFADRVPGSVGFACDVSDPDQVEKSFAEIDEKLGPVDVLLYNAGSGSWNDPEETTAEDMETSWRVNVLGCLMSAQKVIPGMIGKGSGSIVITGATASLRGNVKTTAFASSKAGQRSLAQSLAKHLGPKGIHVSYVIVDGVIDLPRTRAMLPDKPDTFYLKPDDIAESVFFLTRQPRSAWTFEIDLRPFGEKW